MNQDAIDEINRIVNDLLGGSTSSGKRKGTSYWYYAYDGKKYRVCFTKAKTHRNGVLGFYSWVYYYKKKNKSWNMMKCAKSGSKKNCEARAMKLAEVYRAKEEGK